jgi:hypothetical protein
MKRAALCLIASLILSSGCFAQQNSSDEPASRADIEKYLDLVHMRELMKLRVESSRAQLHEVIHNFIQKQGQFPDGFEVRMLKMADDILKDYPSEEMLDAMIPVYQKHLTKGEAAALISFYSSPTGQTIVQKLPVITTESAQATSGVAQKMLASAVQRVQEAMAQELKEDEGKPQKPTQKN